MLGAPWRATLYVGASIRASFVVHVLQSHERAIVIYYLIGTVVFTIPVFWRCTPWR